MKVAHQLLYPQLPVSNTSYDPMKAVHLLDYAPEKKLKLVVINFRVIKEMTKDTLKDFKAHSWLLRISYRVSMRNEFCCHVLYSTNE